MEKEAKAEYAQALEDWDVKLDQFVNWLTRTKGFTKKVSSSIHCTIKSLIKYNSRLKLSIGTPSVGLPESLKPITMDEFKKMFAVATLQQRWLLTGLKDSGMSREDFLELTYGDIKESFEKGLDFIPLKVSRRKEQLHYETFLGPNAVETLRLYLDIRKRRGEVITDKSFLTVQDIVPYEKLALNSLSKTVMRIGERVGIKASPHRLRKMFDTYLALKVRHPIILKYWMGHKLKMSDIEASYIIPPTPEQLKLYQEAYPNIDLTGGTLEERAKKAAKEQLEAMLTPEQRELLHKAYMRKGEPAKIPPKPKREKDCNGEHCEFKQVNESELLQCLKDGWQVIHKLSNGDIIVKR